MVRLRNAKERVGGPGQMTKAAAGVGDRVSFCGMKRWLMHSGCRHRQGRAIACQASRSGSTQRGQVQPRSMAGSMRSMIRGLGACARRVCSHPTLGAFTTCSTIRGSGYRTVCPQVGIPSLGMKERLRMVRLGTPVAIACTCCATCPTRRTLTMPLDRLLANCTRSRRTG